MPGPNDFEATPGGADGRGLAVPLAMVFVCLLCAATGYLVGERRGSVAGLRAGEQAARERVRDQRRQEAAAAPTVEVRAQRGAATVVRQGSAERAQISSVWRVEFPGPVSQRIDWAPPARLGMVLEGRK